MSPSQVLAALQAWDALNLPTNSSLDAHGEDGKRYPRERHMLAWDLDQAMSNLSVFHRGVAISVITGEAPAGHPLVSTVCEILSDELEGLITF